MSTLYLSGFNTKVQLVLAEFLLSREKRPPGWQLTDDLDQATVILVNAASQSYVEECARLAAPWQDLALVGDTDFGTGWMLIPRPVTPSSILNGINQVMAMRSQMSHNATGWGDATQENTTSMPLTRPTRHAPLAPAASVDAAQSPSPCQNSPKSPRPP
jgi:hypothetical protein